jgi:hypothetical protein
MPVPVTPSRPISYPSLQVLGREDEVEVDSPGEILQSPSVMIARKAAAMSPPDQPTMKIPGSFKVPKGSNAFNFDFKSKLSEEAQRVLEETEERAAAIRAKMPLTPANDEIRTPPNRQIATAVRKKRFSDVHKAEFAKMGSIVDHYAARRPRVVTPQNPQKGIKRTQSQVSLDQKSMPSTPSPVKKRPSEEFEKAHVDRSTKRARMESISSFKAKLAEGTPAKLRLPVTAAQSVITRRVSNAKRLLPALPRTAGIKPTIRLVPRSAKADFPASKIPKTPSARRVGNFAPATVAAAPRFRLLKPSAVGTSSAAVGTSPASPRMSETENIPTTGKPRVIRQLKKLSVSGPRVGVLSPVKFFEKPDLEDPFGIPEPSNSMGWEFEAPDGNPSMPTFPEAPTHEPKPNAGKRKEMDSAPEDTGREASSMSQGEGEMNPAKKRQKLGAGEQEKNPTKRSLFDKSRLEFLAAPKRRIDKIRGTKSTKKTIGGRPLWK